MAHFRGTRRFGMERHSERGGRRFKKEHREGFRLRDRDKKGQPELTNVICDKCGKHAKVPFTPTENKPIYCRDCFRKPGGAGAKNKATETAGSLNQLEQINQKLDRIMKALNLK